MKPFKSFVNNNKLNNKLNDINYRVKWALGKWYYTSQIIKLPNKYYFSNDYNKKKIIVP